MRRTLSEAFEIEATAEQNEIEQMARNFLKFDEDSEMVVKEEEEKENVNTKIVEDKESAYEEEEDYRGRFDCVGQRCFSER